MIKGYWRDTFIYPDGKKKTTEWKKNTICYKGLIALWGLLSANTGFLNGIDNIYYAVGNGDVSWDGMSPLPSPSSTDVKLVAEATPKAEARKNPISIAYLDDAGEVTTTPTRRLYIETRIESTDLVGDYIREFGIFIGNATGETDSGYMLNHVIHDVIHKGNFAMLRQIKLVISV